VDGDEDKNLRVFLHICMTTEGVWTQVAQLNKFECWISILQVCKPKWHVETSLRAVGVFNS
jgi:hypothetical protein